MALRHVSRLVVLGGHKGHLSCDGRRHLASHLDKHLGAGLVVGLVNVTH